jgi:hypothetical protein
MTSTRTRSDNNYNTETNLCAPRVTPYSNLTIVQRNNVCITLLVAANHRPSKTGHQPPLDSQNIRHLPFFKLVLQSSVFLMRRSSNRRTYDILFIRF